MVFQVRSLGLQGVSGYEVSAECDLSSGLPAFTLVGLPDAAVNEARERVRSAIKNCGFHVPGQPHHCQSGPRPCEEVRHAVRPAHPGRHPGRRRAAEGAGPGLRLCGGAVPVRGTAPRGGHPAHGTGRRAGWHPLSLRSGGQCRRGHPGRRARRLPGPGRGPAGRAICTGEEPISPARALGTRPRPRARPRLLPR